MRIVFASSEIHPFVKTGGLADVAGALPGFLSSNGSDVIAVMPFYRQVMNSSYYPELCGVADVYFRGESIRCEIFRTILPGSDVMVYMPRNDAFFDRDDLYGYSGGNYDDNDLRFAFFCSAVMGICRSLNFVPDVIHCNEWQTGLVPVYLETLFRVDPFFSHTATLFTIHNMAYHGLFEPGHALEATGLPWKVYDVDGVEFHGRFSFLKGGIYYSDILNTVSPTYSLQIQEEEYGFGLQGLLRSRKNTLFGVLNGLDYRHWDPLNDTVIPERYGPDDPAGKRACRVELCRTLGLPIGEDVPVIAMISRLTEQKGCDILLEILDRMMNLPAGFVLLGTGEPEYHESFRERAERYAGRMSLTLKFDSDLSRMIYAGSDIFLMPSLFEPCGISQLIAMKYGTIPVVRKTGGLADTVIDYGDDSAGGKQATGFVFSEYSGNAFLECIIRAVELFHDESGWKELMHSAMIRDFSWDSSASLYMQLYRAAAERRRSGHGREFPWAMKR